ncbi:MAG TPA: amino acid permease [Bryobacteraceae bacterium]|nr:amino acid permease [Bryobacteraceae bacterium]
MQSSKTYDPEAHQPSLRRALGLWSTVAIIMGTVIGSGIFLVPTDMVKAVGTPGRVFAVWVFGGILSLFGALTYAELSAALPAAGGEYAYLTAAYGPFWGFLYAWTQTWVAKSASIAALATAFYSYLADFLPGLQAPLYVVSWPIGPGGGPLEIRYGQLLAIFLILFLSAVNYRGVRVGGRVQVGVTALKVILIGGVIAVGLLSRQAHVLNLSTSTTPIPGGPAGFFVALVAALWAYDGWNNAGMLGSEVENPQRTFPLALIAGVTAIIGVYLLTNLAYFSVLNAGEVASSDRVAADMMRRIAGPHGAGAVSVAAMISIFAALNGSILSGSRVPYAMARDGYFFRHIGKVHPIFRTPSASILLLGVWSSLFVLSGHYTDLYNAVIFPSWILYGMTAAAVIVLRRKRPDLTRPYHTWGYPWVPLAFVGVTLLLLYQTLVSSPRASGIGLVVIALGVPFFFYWKRHGKIPE